MRNRIVPLLCFLVVPASVVLCQDASIKRPKTINVSPPLPNAPITIVKVLHQGKTITPGVPFEAADNWLQQVSVVVKNISSSDIIQVSVFGHLPQSGAGTVTSPTVPAENTVGRRPEAAMYSPFTGKPRQQDTSLPIRIEPGKELTIPLMDKDHFDDFNSQITAKQPLGNVTSCDISVATVYFADGTKWSHSYSQPDPITPGRYKPLSFDDWQQIERNR